MKASLLALVVALAAGLTPANASMLSGTKIRAAISGAKLVGVTEYGTPYTVWMDRKGSLRGVLGKKNEFDDIGRWWIDGNALCFQWELWLFAKPVCYKIELEGDRFIRTDLESGTVVWSRLVR